MDNCTAQCHTRTRCTVSSCYISCYIQLLLWSKGQSYS